VLWSKYEPEQFRDELRPGKDYEGNPRVFAFGSNFVDTYLQGRFQNAIIIGMGCFGAGTSYGAGEEVTVQAVETEEGPNLADAFYRQGATAVIGWDSLVTLEFSERATLELISSTLMLSLTTIGLLGRSVVVLELGPKGASVSGVVRYPALSGVSCRTSLSERPP
jgi:hypothetical protein